MNDAYAHRRLALQKIVEELPALLPDQGEELARQVEKDLEENTEAALTRAAATVMQTPARQRFQELLSQDQEMLQQLCFHSNVRF